MLNKRSLRNMLITMNHTMDRAEPSLPTLSSGMMDLLSQLLTIALTKAREDRTVSTDPISPPSWTVLQSMLITSDLIKLKDYLSALKYLKQEALKNMLL